MANGANAPIHHVGRRDDVYACLSLHQGLLGEHRHGFVVEDVALVVEQTILAV